MMLFIGNRDGDTSVRRDGPDRTVIIEQGKSD